MTKELYVLAVYKLIHSLSFNFSLSISSKFCTSSQESIVYGRYELGSYFWADFSWHHGYSRHRVTFVSHEVFQKAQFLSFAHQKTHCLKIQPE